MGCRAGAAHPTWGARAPDISPPPARGDARRQKKKTFWAQGARGSGLACKYPVPLHFLMLGVLKPSPSSFCSFFSPWLRTMFILLINVHCARCTLVADDGDVPPGSPTVLLAPLAGSRIWKRYPRHELRCGLSRCFQLACIR